MDKIAVGLVALLLVAMPMLGLPPAATARGKTFVVNSAADPGTGNCDEAECTLREAILAANAHDGADRIEFNIPGSGPHTIALTTGLPAITERVTIDGSTQPGASPNTVPLARNGTNAVIKIVLDGDPGTPSFGLRFEANKSAKSVVRGLAIARFSLCGILADAAGIKIEGNFIGTNAAGNTDLGSLQGICVTDIDGTIGGTRPDQRNLISGNAFGIVARITCQNLVVQGNLIGTDTTGAAALPNGSGITFESDAKKALIGGTTPEAGNVIAFNIGDGVNLGAPSNVGVRILSNSIFSHQQQGIDLGNDGPTANDSGDPDTGANRLQNFPVLTLADSAGGQTTIQGTLNSTPRTEFLIQVFKSPNGQTDEGEFFLIQGKVKTNAQGLAAFELVADLAFPTNTPITATATNLEKKDTSEFSAAVLVT